MVIVYITAVTVRFTSRQLWWVAEKYLETGVLGCPFASIISINGRG